MKRIIKKLLTPFPGVKIFLRKVYNRIKKNENALVQQNPIIKKYSKKVIFFDITSHSVSEVKTGIQRVVSKFIEYIQEVVGDKYVIECISGLGGYHIIDMYTYQPDFQTMICLREGDIYLSIDFNPVQPYEYWDTLKQWQDNGCKLYACVYDLVYEKYPEYVADKEAVRLLSRWLHHATANFDGLICISKTVEMELREWIKQNSIKNSKLQTGYFYLGADFDDNEKDENDSTIDFFKSICSTEKTNFLAVSTIEPRKGYDELISAFESALDKGNNVNLLIVGRKGWKYKETVKKIINSKYYNNSIFWFSDCNDEMLGVLYSLADCFVTNSYYEGFGLGIIEASNRGLPLLLRDIPINREVSNGQALYFKTETDLVEILGNIAVNRNLIADQDKLKALSWKESVQMAWNTLEKMMKENR